MIIVAYDMCVMTLLPANHHWSPCHHGELRLLRSLHPLLVTALTCEDTTDSHAADVTQLHILPPVLPSLYNEWIIQINSLLQ